MRLTILQSLTGVKKGVATRRQLGKQEAVNMYTMGTTFIRKIRDVWQIAKTM